MSLTCSSLVAAEIVILGSGKVSPVYHSYLIFLFSKSITMILLAVLVLFHQEEEEKAPLGLGNILPENGNLLARATPVRAQKMRGRQI